MDPRAPVRPDPPPALVPSPAPWRLLTLGTLALDKGAAPTEASVLGPRKLALLAYLALAPRPLTRDHLAALFWGEREEARARHSLREALSALRQLLGPDAIARGGDRVALAPAVGLEVDLRALLAAAAVGDAGRVVALYAGPFLDGVHAGASSAFRAWADAQRVDAERAFVEACAAECRRLRELEHWEARAALARRWLAAAPLDPRPARILLRSVAAPGTREALRLAGVEYARVADQLAAEFSVAPDASVTEVARGHAARLAVAVEPNSVFDPALPVLPERAATPDAPPVEPDADPLGLDAVPETRWGIRVPRRWRAAVTGGFVALLCVLSVAVRHAAGIFARRRPGVVAILPLAADAQSSEARWLSAAVPKLLRDALARAAEVEVVEVAPPNGAARAGADPAAERDAARRAGATIAVSAALDTAGGRYVLRLDARDLTDDGWRREAVVSDTLVFTLVERAAVALAGVLGASDAPHLAGVETGSVEAYRAYLDALRLTTEGRADEATRALDRAIATDSGFVTAVAERRRRMAHPMTAAADDSARRLVAAFERGLTRATPYDRTDFEATVAFFGGDHVRAERLATDLAARYPHDPRATGRAVEVLALHGRFAEAIALTRRSQRSDSARRPSGAADGCDACTDHAAFAELLALDGQLPEAEAQARTAVARAPDRPASWAALSRALAARGRWDEAIAASERARALAPADHDYAFEPERRLVEAGRLDEAARRLRPWLAAADGDLALAAADVEALRLRELGRYAEAVRVLDAGLRRAPGWRVIYDLSRGASHAAHGDAARAAAAYTTPAAPAAALAGDSRWRQQARAFAWPRALMADALYVAAEAGGRPVDARRLVALADSVEVVGSRSYYGRDWRLHHHVRGLVAAGDGRWADAAAEFRRARWGRAGWTRTLVELARAELALGRSDSALAALRDARATVLDGMGRYATRSSLDFWTARAFAAAGREDSAAVYAGRVRRAWAGAEPAALRQLALLPR